MRKIGKSRKLPTIMMIACCITGIQLLTLDASAKRIIFVAEDDQLYTNWADKHYQDNPEAGDNFVREEEGKSFLDAWNNLANNDELIILTHGGKGCIKLGGKRYGGFKKQGAAGGGTGTACDPYPIPLKTVNNVTVTFKVCYAGSDPDGNGAKISTEESIKPCLDGTDNTYWSKDGIVQNAFCLTYNGGTAAQRANARNCLTGVALVYGKTYNEWMLSMTYQEHAFLQGYIDSCRVDGDDVDDVHLSFAYEEPLKSDYDKSHGETAFEFRSTSEDQDCFVKIPNEPCDCESEEIPSSDVKGLIILTLILLTAGIILIKRYKLIAAKW